jgi:hypothetical protein
VNQLFVVIPEIGWNLARPGARGRLMQNQKSKIKNQKFQGSGGTSPSRVRAQA